MKTNSTDSTELEEVFYRPKILKDENIQTKAKEVFKELLLQIRIKNHK
jgi:hypothetical protein